MLPIEPGARLPQCLRHTDARLRHEAIQQPVALPECARHRDTPPLDVGK